MYCWPSLGQEGIPCIGKGEGEAGGRRVWLLLTESPFAAVRGSRYRENIPGCAGGCVTDTGDPSFLSWVRFLLAQVLGCPR